jgi:hypothetical protein
VSLRTKNYKTQVLRVLTIVMIVKTLTATVDDIQTCLAMSIINYTV